MKLKAQLAAQFREVYLSGTWVATNLHQEISDVTWEEATMKIGPVNTIAALAFHINYYVAGVSQVLDGGTLDIRDKYSFDMPPISDAADWDKLRQQISTSGERFVALVEQLDETLLAVAFVKAEYGTYYRNIAVIIEHSYYHLGQIVLLKKLIRATNPPPVA